MSNDVINIGSDQNESISLLVDYLFNTIERLVVKEKRPFVTIGLSGASLVKFLSNELIRRKDLLKPFSSQLQFLFCDERFVPLDHADSTYCAFMNEKLFEQLQVPAEHVHAIKTTAANVEECAADYATRLSKLLNSQGGFDILILGMGPDGHTCSLFPAHKLFVERDGRLVAPISDSPKPPPCRVTLTLEHINRSSHLLFWVTGESKAEIVRKIFVDKDESLPSACVKPLTSDGTLKWYLDSAAAKLL